MARNPVVVGEELTTRQKIAVMQAFCNGKQIEYRTSRQGLIDRFHPPLLVWNVWITQAEPIWNWDQFEFRVKE